MVIAVVPQSCHNACPPPNLQTEQDLLVGLWIRQPSSQISTPWWKEKGRYCTRLLDTECLSLVADMNRPPDKSSDLPLAPTSGAQQRQAQCLPRMLLLQITRQTRCGTPLNKQESVQTLDCLLRFLTTARPKGEGTCMLCSLHRERPTYLRPQICVAVKFVGLDVDVLLRSLPCSSNLRCKVFGGQLYHCQAVSSTARVSDLDDGLHLRANNSCRSESFKMLHCMGICSYPHSLDSSYFGPEFPRHVTAA